MRRLPFVFALAVTLVLGTATVAAAAGPIEVPAEDPSGEVGLPPGCLGLAKSESRVAGSMDDTYLLRSGGLQA